MPPVGFEPTIAAGEWPQTYALDRAATETGDCVRFKYLKRRTAEAEFGLLRQRKCMITMSVL